MEGGLPPVLDEEDAELVPAIREAVDMYLCASAFGWDLRTYRQQPPAYRKTLLLVHSVRKQLEKAPTPGQGEGRA